MDDRINQLMNFILNDQKHLKRYLESGSVFKQQKKSQLKQEITANAKPLLKGQFFSYSKLLKQFKLFYFELYTNVLIKYQDKTKAPPVEHVYLQYCSIGEETETIGDSVAYGITLVCEDEIAKLVIDKLNTHMAWLKQLKKFCRQTNFTHRYKVEARMYDHFYRCVDKKKKMYASVKIMNKKGLKPEQKQLVNQEIAIFRKVQSPLLPRLKKIYEDENYIYMNFEFFQGEDLLKIVSASKLEEIAIATLTHHVLKGLKSLHAQNVFHGNLKLDNIIFGSTQRDENEIFLINLKYNEEITEFYRERLIKKGMNNYVAPEVLEGGRIGQEMDMFALGVCVYFMAFNKYPYSKIEKIPTTSYTQAMINGALTSNAQSTSSQQINNQQQLPQRYRYELDLKLLENLQKEKKLNPSKVTNNILSASGIDFLMRLLDVNPETRLQAHQALTHHWFINFTTKPTDNKKLAEFRQSKKMQSLITILECSEISERERDPRIMNLRGLTQQSIHTQMTSRTQTNISEKMINSLNNGSSNNIHSNGTTNHTTKDSSNNIKQDGSMTNSAQNTAQKTASTSANSTSLHNHNSHHNQFNSSFHANNHHHAQHHSGIQNQHDVSTTYTQGESVSEEGSSLMSLMRSLQNHLPQPKLMMNRGRVGSNPENQSGYSEEFRMKSLTFAQNSSNF